MKIWVKGAGDLATGISWRLYHCGFSVLMTELPEPTTVRRTVAFSEAVYEGETVVEGVKAVLAHNVEEGERWITNGVIPILVDPEGTAVGAFRPDVLVDAIIAKRNTGTRISDASLVIGVGPGFTAGLDCHFAVETKRGHFLGRVIAKGSPILNTGIPGEIRGYSRERIIRAEADGLFRPLVQIGDQVETGQIVAEIGGRNIRAQMPGLVRGMLKEGLMVTKGMKCGDIDARCNPECIHTISDKARSVAGGVLEAILRKR